MAEALAVRGGVLALPGGFFGRGRDGHLRLAFANLSEGALPELTRRVAALREP